MSPLNAYLRRLCWLLRQGEPVDVPLAYKDELWVVSHADAITVRVPDAPAPDEIVVVAAVASRGRIHARLGGMSKEDADAAG